MTLEKFRILHSTLIEHYQFIESHMEGIYAAVCDKSLADGLNDVKRDGLAGILQDIRHQERVKNLQVFDDRQEDQLRELFQRRNFWCHSCYLELPFDLKTGGPANVLDAQQMLEDLKTAEHWREFLFGMKIRLLKENEKI